MFITMEKSASIVYEYTLVLKKEKPKKKEKIEDRGPWSPNDK